MTTSADPWPSSRVGRYFSWTLTVFIFSFLILPSAKSVNNVFYVLLLLPGIIFCVLDRARIAASLTGSGIVFTLALAFVLWIGVTSAASGTTQSLKHLFYVGVFLLSASRLVVPGCFSDPRFGRSLFGSSAASGTMNPDDLRELRDRDGISLPDAIAQYGLSLDTVKNAHAELKNAAAYLELHIEQGPVLESMQLPLGVVLGTFGVERHRIIWKGQAAHAGSTPMDRRKDALAGAAKLALEIRPIAARAGNGAVCTSGGVVCKPGIVTSVVEIAEQILDQRHLDLDTLTRMLQEAKDASAHFAEEENIDVSWEPIWRIDPILFNPELIEMADEAIRETCGTVHRLPSGPLHDAAEVARIGIPTVMLFVQSLRGISHNKIEDTCEEHIELSVQALDRLASKAMVWIKG